MKLIVGLGNPEEKYAGTRHNLGFDLVTHFASKLLPVKQDHWEVSDKFKAEICRIKEGDYDLLLVKPQTYMNHSGLAVSKIAKFYKVSPEDILIAYDELDLPLGKIKIRIGGAAAGHHGVESVMNELGTDKFGRLRLGIGSQKAFSGERKEVSFSAEDYVLHSFSSKESSDVKKMIKQAIKAIEVYLEKGLDVAQTQFN